MAVRTRRRSTFKQAVANNAPPTPANAAAVWWADDIAQTDGSQVTTWTDRINNISVTQATAGARPLYDTDGLNGKPSVNFDGVDDWLGINSSISSSSSGCVVAVFRNNGSVPSFKALWSTGSTSVNQVYILGRLGHTQPNQIGIQLHTTGSTADWVKQVDEPVLSSAANMVSEWSSGGAAWQIRMNNQNKNLTYRTGSGFGDGRWMDVLASCNYWSIGVNIYRYNGNVYADSHYDMRLAYLGVFDSPLSAQDRYNLYKWIESYYGITGMPGLSDYEQAVLVDSPAAFWPMQEASGSITDIVSARTGTPVGAAKTYQQGGPIAGINSIAFDGSSSSGYSVVDDNLWSSTVFSVEGWVYMSSAFLSGQVLRYWFAKEFSGYNEWQMMVQDYGGGAIRHAGTVKNSIDGPYAMTDDPINRTEQSWYHIVYTFNNTSTGGILYVNGAQVDVSSGSGARRGNGSGSLTIGWSPDVATRSWKGRLSMIAFYDTVLTPTQVSAHYQAMAP